MKEGQELVEVPEAAIDLFDAFSDPIAELEEKNPRVKFDITTYEGETECKKYIAQIGQLRIGVEALRKTLKKEFLDKGRAVDKDAKKKQDRIAAIDAVHSVPLKALEQKRIDEVLKAREEEKAELKRIDDERLKDLQDREDAAQAKEAELKAKEDALNAETNAVQMAKDLKEAERVGAANAVIIEKQRQADEESQKAENELQEKIAADKVIADRQANVEHRKKFNRAAANALDAITGDSDISVAVVIAIVSGTIPNVTLNY
jgi:hypothetical protein